MTATVPYGSVVDTTADRSWTPVTVTATLAEPIIGLDTNPMALDGPLSWAAADAAIQAGIRIPPIGKDRAVDLALPVATWTAPPSRPDADPRLLAADGVQVWGWACSVARYEPLAYTVESVRRRPSVAQMARYATDRKHHAGLGPHKARDTPMAATWVDAIQWDTLADADRLSQLLTRVTHLGRVTRHGHGRILAITVTASADREAWRHRPMPDRHGRPDAIRAPYHHHSRRMPCSTPATPVPPC